MKQRRKRSRWLPLSVLVAAFVVIVAALFAVDHGGRQDRRRAPAEKNGGPEIRFTDLHSQMREYIGYNKTIRLTPEQEEIKKAALESRPAACCRDYSAYTCCCECNLSKSVWGLSNYLIATKGFSADDVSRTVAGWLAFANPDGFSGDACFNGGCSRSPAANGCGGMDESKVVS